MPKILATTMPTTPLSDADYRRFTSAALERIEATVDRWLQDDVIDIDTQRTGGLLELSFPGGSKIVVNGQPPLQELWLAAPAGGYHFKLVDGCWCDTRDGVEFFARLSELTSAQGAKSLSF